VAREKYEISQLIPTLANPDFWIEWVDTNGEVHHTPRSLAAVIPSSAKIVK
jgi:hypothetical protein